MEIDIFDLVYHPVCDQDKLEEGNPSDKSWLKSLLGSLHRFVNGEDPFAKDGSEPI